MESTSTVTKGRICCKETGCNFEIRFLANLRNHLAEAHGYKFNTFSKDFSSLQGIQLIFLNLCIIDNVIIYLLYGVTINKISNI